MKREKSKYFFKIRMLLVEIILLSILFIFIAQPNNPNECRTSTIIPIRLINPHVDVVAQQEGHMPARLGYSSYFTKKYVYFFLFFFFQHMK